MLVFISDLHFMDETAGKHNIPASAFETFLTNVEVHADKAKAKELKIAFLGDIFDILRTEEWFKEEEVDRPWGNNTANVQWGTFVPSVLDGWLIYDRGCVQWGTFVPSVLDGWLIYDRGCGMSLSWKKIGHITETPSTFPPFL